MPLDFVHAVLVVVGLILFEVISSIDNAVVNADVLATMSARARRWFLVYGMLVAVFLIRGFLPLLIIYFTNPALGLSGAFTATFSADPAIHRAIESSAPILLAGGGLYLVLLFLHWLFVEEKQYAFFFERHIHRKLSFWFYTVASFLLLAVVWTTLKINPLIALGAVIGSTAFFITTGFKKNAEEKEKELAQSRGLSDVSKILYLEIIDGTFSIDGVLGAFAFTLSIPLILIGSGIGAYVVRTFTIHGIATVKKYRYLKNGAMYSVGSLGAMMLVESLGLHPQPWIAPLITLVVVSIFFWLSRHELVMQGAMKG